MSVRPSPGSDETLPVAPRGTGRRAVAIAGVLLATWALLTGLLILAGEGIEHSAAVTSLDRHVTTFVVDHRSPALDQVMKAVTWTGSWIAALAVASLVVGFAWRRRLSMLAVVAVVVAWLGELLAVTVTKSVVQRQRPPESVRLVVTHGWAFPSGHTANAVVVFTTAAVLMTTLVRRGNARVFIWVVAGLAIALVAFSRIELGVHWMTDVVASTIWTAGWLLVVARCFGGRALVIDRRRGTVRE
jgi:membrane-associated phospholipid phosphatase